MVLSIIQYIYYMESGIKSVCRVIYSVCCLGISSALVGGVVGGVVFLLLVVLLCGFGTGMIAVYLLRKKKEEKQSMNCYTLVAYYS